MSECAPKANTDKNHSIGFFKGFLNNNNNGNIISLALVLITFSMRNLFCFFIHQLTQLKNNELVNVFR